MPTTRSNAPFSFCSIALVHYGERGLFLPFTVVYNNNMDERQLSFSFEDEEKKNIKPDVSLKLPGNLPSQNIHKEARRENVGAEKNSKDTQELVEGSSDCPRCGRTVYGIYQQYADCPCCKRSVFMKEKE